MPPREGGPSREGNRGGRTMMELRTAFSQHGSWEVLADRLTQILDRGLNDLDDPTQVQEAQRMLMDTRVRTPAVEQTLQRIENHLHNLGVRPTEAVPLPSAEAVPLPSAETHTEQQDQGENDPTIVREIDPTVLQEFDRADHIQEIVKTLTEDIKQGREGSAASLLKKAGGWRQEVNQFSNELLRAKMMHIIEDAEDAADQIDTLQARFKNEIKRAA